MTWSEITKPMRAAVKALGVKRTEISIREKSGAQLEVRIELTGRARIADVLEAIAEVWYSEKHAWLYLWVYGPDGHALMSGLSDGYVPPAVVQRIALLRLQVIP